AVSSPVLGSISAMATLAPSPANRIAVARPIPLPAPVMKATLPASLGIPFSFATVASEIIARTPVPENDTPLAQCRDLIGRIAAAGEDVIAMLAKGRGRRWRRSRRLSKFDLPLHRTIPPDLRMIEGRNEILGEHLRMVEHVLDRAHCRAWYALAEFRISGSSPPSFSRKFVRLSAGADRIRTLSPSTGN